MNLRCIGLYVLLQTNAEKTHSLLRFSLLHYLILGTAIPSWWELNNTKQSDGALLQDSVVRKLFILHQAGSGWRQDMEKTGEIKRGRILEIKNKMKYSENHEEFGLSPVSARAMVLRRISSRGVLCSEQPSCGLSEEWNEEGRVWWMFRGEEGTEMEGTDPLFLPHHISFGLRWSREQQCHKGAAITVGQNTLHTENN